MAETTVTRPLQGKLAIISGGSRGIGAAVAHNLAAKGCNLVLNYTSDSSTATATTLATTLSTTHAITAIPARADVSTADGCAAIIAAAKTSFESPTTPLRIDIVINNAAVQSAGPLGTLTEDEFTRVYRLNVLGPIHLMQAALPYLPHDRSGRIVNMSSVTNSSGMPGYTLYAGTKGAIEAMTRVWSRELAERATVNAVNIGPTMTDMLAANDPNVLKTFLESWMLVTPLAAPRESVDTPRMLEFAEALRGRPGYVEEVAGVVGMLCSPEAGWSTGGLVGANGGGRPGF